MLSSKGIFKSWRKVSYVFCKSTHVYFDMMPSLRNAPELYFKGAIKNQPLRHAHDLSGLMAGIKSWCEDANASIIQALVDNSDVLEYSTPTHFHHNFLG